MDKELISKLEEIGVSRVNMKTLIRVSDYLYILFLCKVVVYVYFYYNILFKTVTIDKIVYLAFEKDMSLLTIF